VIKYAWKVQSAPTGRYRSFERRGWPSAETPDGDTIAMLACKDEYTPYRVRTGDHAPIRLMIRVPKGNGQWGWGTFQHDFASMDEAKEFLKNYLARHPDYDFCITK